MMMRWWIGCSLAMLAVVPSVAHSQASAPPSTPFRERIQVQGDKDGLKKPLERFHKPGAGASASVRAKTKAAPAKQEIVGRLIRGGAGDVFIERTIDARTAEQLARMGFREITSDAELADRTIRGDKVYLLYEVDPKAFVPMEASRLEGQIVSLQIEKDSSGTPIVVALKKAEGAR